MDDTEFYRFIDNLPFMIAHVDDNRRYRFIKRRYAAHFGMSNPANVVGATLAKYLEKSSTRNYRLLLTEFWRERWRLTKWNTSTQLATCAHLEERSLQSTTTKGIHVDIMMSSRI